MPVIGVMGYATLHPSYALTSGIGVMGYAALHPSYALLIRQYASELHISGFPA
jgi:hypothetical protein